MKRLINVPEREDIAKIARLEHNSDMSRLVEILKDANNNITKMLKESNVDSNIYRLQGAGQVLDEIIEIVEKAKAWVIDIKKQSNG
jgi:hypothetical protein